ncbi:serine/threonine-protein kinase [Mycoplasma sp. Ms02]|uniref:serine/threonine-protein kinase n=1 Tax=Mycoplasma sp. Ms02 TaxID=353851 RepID=UPI001C88F5D1|nr:serine/threonine-protein kinase [Mycoplasma sp. Ms02]QZE12635.1 Kae1-associated serine/threonine protein kinase [Mycoplasma sp. Ms02]
MPKFYSAPPKDSTVYKKYNILRVIGHGGSSTVYLVEPHGVSNKLFALKYRHRDNNHDNYTRFLNELNLIKKIKSNNVPRYHSSYVDDNEQYIVMEYVEGNTLRDSIDKNGYLDVRRSLLYTKQIAQVVGQLHSLGVIHRDLKSQNIIITKNQTIKIIDLGISINQETTRVTKTHNIICSVYYSAPELASKNIPTTNSVDVYALGIMLYEMLTAKYPFEHDDPTQIIWMHKNKKVPAISPIRNIPDSIDDLIANATNKDYRKRFKNISDFVAAIDDCLFDLNNPEDFEKLKRIKDKNKKFFNNFGLLVTIAIISLIVLGASIFALVGIKW